MTSLAFFSPSLLVFQGFSSRSGRNTAGSSGLIRPLIDPSGLFVARFFSLPVRMASTRLRVALFVAWLALSGALAGGSEGKAGEEEVGRTVVGGERGEPGVEGASPAVFGGEQAGHAGERLGRGGEEVRPQTSEVALPSEEEALEEKKRLRRERKTAWQRKKRAELKEKLVGGEEASASSEALVPPVEALAPEAGDEGMPTAESGGLAGREEEASEIDKRERRLEAKRRRQALWRAEKRKAKEGGKAMDDPSATEERREGESGTEPGEGAAAAEESGGAADESMALEPDPSSLGGVEAGRSEAGVAPYDPSAAAAESSVPVPAPTFSGAVEGPRREGADIQEQPREERGGSEIVESTPLFGEGEPLSREDACLISGPAPTSELSEDEIERMLRLLEAAGRVLRLPTRIAAEFPPTRTPSTPAASTGEVGPRGVVAAESGEPPFHVTEDMSEGLGRGEEVDGRRDSGLGAGSALSGRALGWDEEEEEVTPAEEAGISEAQGSAARLSRESKGVQAAPVMINRKTQVRPARVKKWERRLRKQARAGHVRTEEAGVQTEEGERVSVETQAGGGIREGQEVASQASVAVRTRGMQAVARRWSGGCQASVRVVEGHTQTEGTEPEPAERPVSGVSGRAGLDAWTTMDGWSRESWGAAQNLRGQRVVAERFPDLDHMRGLPPSEAPHWERVSVSYNETDDPSDSFSPFVPIADLEPGPVGRELGGCASLRSVSPHCQQRSGGGPRFRCSTLRDYVRIAQVKSKGSPLHLVLSWSYVPCPH